MHQHLHRLQSRFLYSIPAVILPRPMSRLSPASTWIILRTRHPALGEGALVVWWRDYRGGRGRGRARVKGFFGIWIWVDILIDFFEEDAALGGGCLIEMGCVIVRVNYCTINIFLKWPRLLRHLPPNQCQLASMPHNPKLMLLRLHLMLHPLRLICPKALIGRPNPVVCFRHILG